MPAALSVILNNAFRVIDQYFVQWIGTAAQAAIGSCTFVLIAFFALYSVVSAGAGPLLARAIGAQDAAAQGRIFGRSLVGAVAIGVVVLLLCGFGAGAIVATLGLEGAAASEAETYLRWLALAGLPLTLSPLVDAAFISLGRAGQMMALQVVATVLNGLLNWPGHSSGRPAAFAWASASSSLRSAMPKNTERSTARRAGRRSRTSERAVHASAHR